MGRVPRVFLGVVQISQRFVVDFAAPAEGVGVGPFEKCTDLGLAPTGRRAVLKAQIRAILVKMVRASEQSS